MAEIATFFPIAADSRDTLDPLRRGETIFATKRRSDDELRT
jgi:hypothetical protein